MRTPLLLLALLLPLTACGGDDDEAPSAAPSTTSPSTTSPRATASPTATATPDPTPTPTTATPSSSAPTATPAGEAPATAAPSAPPAPGQAGRSTPARPATRGVPRMTGDGVDLPSRVLVFGTTYVDARGPLDATLGPPSLDTGTIDTFSSYGTCPGQDLRVLEYAGGALRLLFGTLQGGAEMTFYAWVLADDGTPSAVPEAGALVGDVTTYDFGVGTTVAQLQTGLGGTLAITEGDELGGPSFRVADQSSGLFGRVTATGPAGAVTFVQGGQGCGE